MTAGGKAGWIVAVWLAALPMTAPAIAADANQSAVVDTDTKELLRLMDRDRNGMVSHQEFMQFMAAEFRRLDLNKDGVLDVGELGRLQVRERAADSATPLDTRLAAGAPETRQLLLAMDADRNGKVSRQEFMQFMEAEFQRLDTNKDSELDVAELTQVEIHGRRGASRK
jgi:Ca2+-binding EF-hand superfamily protein